MLVCNNNCSKKSNSEVSSLTEGQDALGKNPGERAFFKLLHAEFNKATHFFGKAQKEFTIREERVREGMEIMKQPNAIMVNEKWSLLAKSIYRLYKDLLLLETFAIMTYCSFSKILKKHDKVTGCTTRTAFMTNVVNKANFTNYPEVLKMIDRCQCLYDDVSKRLLQEGKEGLYEDERLFINMISRLNEQVLDNSSDADESDKALMHAHVVKKRASHQTESLAVSTLRSIVDDCNASDASSDAGKDDGAEDSFRNRKREIVADRKPSRLISDSKRPKPSASA